MAAAIMQRFFGVKARRIAAVGGGITNFVFRATHTEGEFVIRLSPEPGKINEFLKEQWAMARAAEAGVPVPEVLEVGNEASAFPYMVARHVKGTEATGHAERITVVQEMGRLMRLIHSIPTSGFGRTFDWSQNQLSRNGTWADFLASEVRLDERIEVLRLHRMLPDAALDRVRRTLLRLGAHGSAPALNHGDLRPKNVLADQQGRVTAVIDWEAASSSIPPFWDLSISLHDLTVDEKEELLEAYGMKGDDLEESMDAIRAINLVNYAPVAARLAQSRGTDQIARLRCRLSGGLDLYRLS